MKHTLKALAAVATFALSAGYSEAATYNFNVNWTTVVTGCSNCSGSGSGTGTWDNVTNIIDFTGAEAMHIDFNDGTPISDGTVTRHVTINTSVPSYTYVTTACNDGGSNTICASSAQAIGQVRPLGQRIYMMTPTQEQLGPFVWDGVRSIRTVFTGVQYRQFNFSNLTEAPAVPVPAAAWLFGSGLLGLAGAARKRR